MSLNRTVEVSWYLFGSLMILFCAIIIGWNAFSKKNKSALYLFISFLSFYFFYIFTSLSFLFLSFDLYRMTHFLGLSGMFFFLIFINRSSSDTISPIIIGLICSLTSLVLIFIFQPDSIIYFFGFGYASLKTSGILSFIGNFGLMFYALSANYWSLRIILKGPKGIIKSALILFIGTFLTITGYFVWSIQYLLNMPLGIFFTGSGFLIIAIIIIKEPKILYVLPFTAYRLVVIHGRSGVSLFNYKWSEDKMDNEIFSGLLFALQKCSIEVLKKGDMEQIALSDGILIFKKSENITVGLLSSKSSKFLVECVEKFTNEFEKIYSPKITNKVYRADQFNSAIELVEKYFANVPSKVTT